MEFSVLGITENSSLDDAKRALRQIRINNHPDKNRNATQLQLQTLQHLVNLAEEAYQRINSKHLVASVIDTVMTGNQHITTYNPPIQPDFLSDLFHKVNISSRPDRYSHQTTYTYQNINGNVQEFGTVNGKPMSKEQLNMHKMY